ncbi:hypothetical protein TeGR_g13880 [Tetraparma gracilis]|uniref:XPG-I domain-containing protein n=1 Tax=Tetraparma gracilis TaxID=2962635 RepID=A0ABQ6MFP4_9STRA|nr:hypothetical protein TeGR_g13880 [Tetraparma gracilis]
MMRDGPASKSKLHKMFARSVSVTHEMRQELIVRLHALNIQFLVAPYEADAQLAFLARSCLVDVVLSEDGDLLAYGIPRVLFKLDREGNCDEVQHADLGRNAGLSFKNWSHDMFVCMCILAGCDYCPKVRGLGIANAHKIVRREKKPSRIVSAVATRYGSDAPADFPAAFARAFLVFQHQRVFDPHACSVVMLHQPDLDSWYWITARGGLDSSSPLRIGETDFLGREMSVPIHFAEYRSKLLGKSFETVSRRRRRVAPKATLHERLKAQPKHDWVRPPRGEGAAAAWIGEIGDEVGRGLPQERPQERPALPPQRAASKRKPQARGRSTTKRRRDLRPVVPTSDAPPRPDIRQPRSVSAAAAMKPKSFSVDRSRSRSRPRHVSVGASGGWRRTSARLAAQAPQPQPQPLEQEQEQEQPQPQFGLQMFQQRRAASCPPQLLQVDDPFTIDLLF